MPEIVDGVREWANMARIEWEDRHYARKAKAMGVALHPPAIHNIYTKRLERAMAEGTVRIFAAVREDNREEAGLIAALKRLGEVIRFDWGGMGLPPDHEMTEEQHTAVSRSILDAYRRARMDGEIHLFFGMLNGRNVFPDTVGKIRDDRTITVNLSLDDRVGFRGRKRHGQWTGTASIAKAFQLCLTTSQGAVEKYRVEGATPLFLPMGADPEVYRRHEAPYVYDVSFVGARTGSRAALIEGLAVRGIEVATFGPGWESGPRSTQKRVELYAKSRINLGFGDVGPGGKLVCLQRRDVEIPMSSGLYLTRHNPELAGMYELGEEIVCYREVDDLAATIHTLLGDPERATAIREAGYRRANDQHTWDHRMRHMLACMIGVGDEELPVGPTQKQAQAGA